MKVTMDFDIDPEMVKATPVKEESVWQPKYPAFALSNQRLATFRHWPKFLSTRPEDLTEAGLFYTGVGDQCCCFFCGIVLSAWSSYDQPLVDHRKYAKDCGYLNICKISHNPFVTW